MYLEDLHSRNQFSSQAKNEIFTNDVSCATFIPTCFACMFVSVYVWAMCKSVSSGVIDHLSRGE